MTPGGAAQATAWHLYRAMVGVGLVCGVLIVGAHSYTEPIITKKRVEARNASVLRVVPGAHSSVAWRAEPGGAFVPVSSDSRGPDILFAAFHPDGALAGVAVEAAGMGYQDTIRLLYGYRPDLQAIVGVAVLESRETPGLGTRVETDPAFLANFEALDVTVEDGAIAHPITAVKHGRKTEPWQVDGITGATITSTAIADILRESSATWVPRILAARAELRAEVQP